MSHSDLTFSELLITLAMDNHMTRRGCVGVQVLKNKGVEYWRYCCKLCGEYTIVRNKGVWGK